MEYCSRESIVLLRIISAYVIKEIRGQWVFNSGRVQKYDRTMSVEINRDRYLHDKIEFIGSKYRTAGSSRVVVGCVLRECFVGTFSINYKAFWNF